MQYYILIQDRTVGPMSAEQVFAYPVNKDTQVSADGGDWAPLFTRPELMQMLNARANRPLAGSNRVLCGVLAIFLGYLGVHYFITGKTTAGILTILLSCVTCGAWSVITLIQGIMMLCMSDQEFQYKYVDTQKTFPLF
jgi:TM2 domain-containing membrane protein YozV